MTREMTAAETLTLSPDTYLNNAVACQGSVNSGTVLLPESG